MLLRLSATFKKQGIASPTALHRSVPYLMLLHYVSQLPHPNARGTQFLLIRTFGPNSQPKPGFVFMSEFHAVEDQLKTDVLLDFLFTGPCN